MPAYPPYTDLGGNPVYYDQDFGLICQIPGFLADPLNQICWAEGGGATFIDVSSGLVVDWIVAAQALGYVIPAPGQQGPPGVQLPVIGDITQAIQQVIDSVNGISTGIINGITTTVNNGVNGLSTEINNAYNSVAGDVSATTNQLANVINGVGDAVVHQAADLASGVTNTVDAVGNQLSNDIGSVGNTLNSTISDVAFGLSQTIGTSVSLVQQSVSDAQTSLTTQINGIVQSVTDSVNGIGTQLGNAISDTLNALLPGLLDTLTANTAALGRFVQSLQSSLATTGDLWSELINQIGTAINGDVTSLSNAIKAISANTLQQTMDAGEAFLSGPFDAVWDRLLADPSTPQELVGSIQFFRTKGHFWFLIILLPLAVDYAKKLLADATDPFAQHILQQAMSLAQPTLPGINDLIRGQRRGANLPFDINRQASYLGYPAWATDLHSRLSQDRLTAKEYVELWYRDKLSDSDLATALTAISFDPTEQQHLIDHTAFVPGPQDVVRFMQRDTYFPEFVTLYQMDAYFADLWPQAAPDFKHAGVSQSVAQQFWRAHWVLPSLSEGYTLYHRVSANGQGDNVTLPDGSVVRRLIGVGDLNRLQRAAGIEPYWQGPEVAAAFRPITRVDIRRAHAAGVLSQSDVFRGYLNLGYSEADCTTLTNLTLALSTSSFNVSAEPWRSPTRAAMQAAYQNGELSEKALRDYLGGLGYDQAHVDDAVNSGNIVRQTKVATKVIDGVKRLFVAGNWSQDQATARLTAQGLDGSEINDLLTSWSIDQEFTIDHARRATVKLATKTEVTNGYIDGLITRDQAVAMYQALALPGNEIDLELGLADHKIAKQNVVSEINAIHAQYVNGSLSLADTSSQLDQLNVSATQKGALLNRWGAEIAGDRKVLPLTTVAELVKSGLYTADQATLALTNQRYSPADIQSLLALWGAQATVTQEKAAAAAARAAAATAKANAKAAAAAAKLANPEIKRLTAAEIAKAAVDKYIDLGTAQAELGELGYTAEDANVILAEKGVTLPAPPSLGPT